MSQKDETQRALAAYFRTADEIVDQPSDADLIEYDGKDYVVLRNRQGVLAVYRVRTSGALKRLKRWPAELEVY